MFRKISQSLALLACFSMPFITLAQEGGGGLDLTTKTNTIVTTMTTLGLPVLILAICVGVFGYWFKFVTLGFAGAIIIGGVIFGAAPEIAAFLLT